MVQGFYFPQMPPSGLQYYDPYLPPYFTPFTHFAISPSSLYGPQVAYLPQQYYPNSSNNVPAPQLVPYPYVQ